MYGAKFAYNKSMQYTQSWFDMAYTNPDPIAFLNERLCDEFSSVLGLDKFNHYDMINLCYMADSLVSYHCNLCTKSGDLSSLVDEIMRFEFSR